MPAFPTEAIESSIGRALSATVHVEHLAPVGGGCINRGHRIRAGTRDFFVKLNDAARVAMFEAEADGLAEIARTRTVRVPSPICYGSNAMHSWLVLEWLPLSPDGMTSASAARLGTQLAAMHAVHAGRFGWVRDNTIGPTAQSNAQAADWIEFWRERRLRPQLALAARNGYRARLQVIGAQLLAELPKLLAGHRPAASLLHGDLWGGNAAALSDGSPAIFDPAPYYGDREVDIAMTELFGGFPSSFYSAYEAAAPMLAGYAVRRELYNLYHVLNHLNLFGGAYLRQSEAMIASLLAEIR